MSEERPYTRATVYGWVVFALAFGLLISDYMARQVLNAVFPLLKVEWALSDAQLGWLSGIVALMVGLLTFPLSLLADRWGRVKSLTLMAVLWSAATLLCAAAANYSQMLIGRMLVGVGEAAYGSVGIALVISVFPSRMRATLSAAFMAGGLFGQVLGVAIGGEIAGSHGWRAAFMVIGIGGLVLAFLFPIIVREKRVAGASSTSGGSSEVVTRPPLKSLFASRSVKLAYLGSGLQLFSAAALPAWLPTYLGRYHAMSVSEAGRISALLFLACGAGMILCGMASDRVARDRADRKILLAIGYCLGAALALSAAMLCTPGVGATGAFGNRNVSGRGHDWPRRCHGRQPHASRDPRHSLCHADTGEQPDWPCARPDHHRLDGRQNQPARRVPDVADCRGRGSSRVCLGTAKLSG